MPYRPEQTAPEREIFSVSRLNTEVRAVLEGSFPLLWVEGELSNIARPASGHIYFSLKDSHAQVRCAMFRMRGIHLRFRPDNGMQVLIRCRVSLYEGRGEFQLVVEHMEPSGEGALRRAFEELKGRLAREGLFEPEHKQTLPRFPKCIGLITSPHGAALHDIVTVLDRRYPLTELIIYPVPVQGAEAPRAIAQMIRLADHRAECDLLILARGGGSLEDLMAFNDEEVARTIHRAKIPVVSAVGHEIDFTIADFVADLRAATPTAAAELVSPDRRELEEQAASLGRRLAHHTQGSVQRLASRLGELRQRLERHQPESRHIQRQQRVDELELRLTQVARTQLSGRRALLESFAARLGGRTPAHELSRLRQRCDLLNEKFAFAMTSRLDRQRQQLAAALAGLNALSPLATLERGYSITERLPDRRILRDSASLASGDRVKTRLSRGSFTCRVEEVH